MEPTFRNGDMVFVEYIPNGAPLQFGEIGAFAVGNECFIKEYQPDGLHSHSKHYPVMIFDDDASVYLLGRVLSVVDSELIATKKETYKYIEDKDDN